MCYKYLYLFIFSKHSLSVITSSPTMPHFHRFVLSFSSPSISFSFLRCKTYFLVISFALDGGYISTFHWIFLLKIFFLRFLVYEWRTIFCCAMFSICNCAVNILRTHFPRNFPTIMIPICSSPVTRKQIVTYTSFKTKRIVRTSLDVWKWTLATVDGNMMGIPYVP